MLHNDQALGDDNGNSVTRFQRAFLTGKYGNFTFTGGRYNETLVDGNVYDDRVDGVKAEFGKNVKFTAAYGKMSNNDGAFDNYTMLILACLKTGTSDAGKYWRVGLDGKLGKNFNLGFDYIN
jgi:hypothetical protein